MKPKISILTLFPEAVEGMLSASITGNALKNGIFKKSVQTISYLPYFVSWVVVSGLIFSLLLFLKKWNFIILNN